MDATHYSGSDDRDVLKAVEPCENCGCEPCQCAAIEAGEWCERHGRPIAIGPCGVPFGGCDECERRDESDE